MSNTLLDVTQWVVNQYVDDSGKLMDEHRRAMECRDCEELLELGLNAYQWLVRSEETFREAHRLGIGYGENVDQSLTLLLEAWLVRGESALAWVKELGERGHAPDNVGDFCAAYDHVWALVEDRTWADMAAQAYGAVAD